MIGLRVPVRRITGQMLVFGVVDMVLVIPVLFICVMLILNCGLLIMAKQQTAVTAQRMVDVAVEYDDTQNVQHVKSVVEAELKKRCPYITNIECVLTHDTLKLGGHSIPVYESIIKGRMNLMGFEKVIPGFADLQESAVAYAPDRALIAVYTGDQYGGPWTRPAHDKYLWLPAVKLTNRQRPKYIYEVLYTPYFCLSNVHQDSTYTYQSSAIGLAFQNTPDSLGAWPTPKDPR